MTAIIRPNERPLLEERADLHGKGALATAIIHAFIYEQIEFSQLGRHFDDMAAPLQAEGLPIICGDVPPISVPTTNDQP